MRTLTALLTGAAIACLGMCAANTHVTITKTEPVQMRLPGIAEQPFPTPAQAGTTYQVVMYTCAGPDDPSRCTHDTIDYDLTSDDCGKALKAYVAPENGFLSCEPWRVIQAGK